MGQRVIFRFIIKWKKKKKSLVNFNHMEWHCWCWCHPRYWGVLNVLSRVQHTDTTNLFHSHYIVRLAVVRSCDGQEESIFYCNFRFASATRINSFDYYYYCYSRHFFVWMTATPNRIICNEFHVDNFENFVNDTFYWKIYSSFLIRQQIAFTMPLSVLTFFFYNLFFSH